MYWPPLSILEAKLIEFGVFWDCVKWMKQGSLLVSCRYLVGGYLSAEAVVNMFSKAVMETVNWPSISSTLDCVVRPVLGGPDLRLEIRCVPMFNCWFVENCGVFLNSNMLYLVVHCWHYLINTVWYCMTKRTHHSWNESLDLERCISPD